MAIDESEMETARLRVAEGERHVSLQRQIIDHLQEIGGSTELAEQLLTEFQQTLRRHRANQDRIEAELKSS